MGRRHDRQVGGRSEETLFEWGGVDDIGHMLAPRQREQRECLMAGPPYGYRSPIARVAIDEFTDRRHGGVEFLLGPWPVGERPNPDERNDVVDPPLPRDLEYLETRHFERQPQRVSREVRQVVGDEVVGA